MQQVVCQLCPRFRSGCRRLCWCAGAAVVRAAPEIVRGLSALVRRVLRSGLLQRQHLGRDHPPRPACAVVVASIFDDDDNLFQALQAGAQGYLLKDQSTDWLARQLQGMAEGQLPLSPAVARRLLRHFRQPPAATGDDLAELSPREREVLGLLAQGVHIADIGKALAISRHTVGDHVKSIYRKLNISSRAEAALRARSMGLI